MNFLLVLITSLFFSIILYTISQQHPHLTLFLTVFTGVFILTYLLTSSIPVDKLLKVST